MNTDQASLPPSSDPLGETLHMLRLQGSLYCNSQLSAPWGIELPAFDGCMMFHIVTSGSCILEVQGEEPLKLEKGGLALIPHGMGHSLRSEHGVSLIPLFDIPVERISSRYELMKFGGGGKQTQLNCGVVEFDSVSAHHLISMLPRIIYMDAWNQDDGWLQSTIGFISREAKQMLPGGETVITRLADVLVVQMIRHWIQSAPEAQVGWLAALRDPQIGQALAKIHCHAEKDWTLEALAKVACMSRSTFSAKFTRLVGESAMKYLMRWRLLMARARLKDSSDSIQQIAEDLGYQSDAAFSRAFKREFGVSPGSLRTSA